MKSSKIINLFIGMFLLVYSFAEGSRIEKIENKVIQNKIVYVKGESTPFTGTFVGEDIEQEYKDGIKNGIFKGKVQVEGGEYLYEGTFVEGIKHGTWKLNYDTGETKAILEYNYDIPNNQWTYFYKNKKMEGYDTFSNGILSGPLLRFDVNGNILKKVNYNNGFLDGELVFFHDKNVLDTVANFSFGKLDGKIQIFSRENIVQIEGNYKNNKRESVWKFYYKTGDLKVTVPYKDGLKNGKSVIYDRAGGIIQVTYYKNNDEVTSNGELIKKSKPFKDGMVDRFRNFNNSLKYLKYNKALLEI